MPSLTVVHFMYGNGIKKVKKNLEIFKGTAGPYRIENAGPWGGYTVKHVGIQPYCGLPPRDCRLNQI